MCLRNGVAYLALTRPYSHLGTSAIISLFFAYSLGLPIHITILLMAVFVLLAGAQDSMNSLTDIVADRMSWPSRPMGAKLIHTKPAKIFTATLFLMSGAILGALTLLQFSTLLLAVMTIDIFLRIAYSARPFRLKRFPMVGNLVAASFIVLNPFVAAYALSLNPNVTNSIATILAIFYMLSVATFIVEDLVTIDGDRTIGDRTVPLMIGRKHTSILISSIYGLVLLLLMKGILETLQFPWLLGALPAATLIAVSSTLATQSTNTRIALGRCQLLSLTVGLILVGGQLFTSLI